MPGMRSVLLAALAGLLIAGAPVAGCGGDDDETDTVAEPPPPAGGDVTAPAVGDGRGGVRLVKIGDFEQPLYVAQPPGSNDLYVVERGGTIRVVRDGETLPEPFLDLTGEVVTVVEQGLLSVAFAPDFEDSRLLYVYFTDTRGDQRIVEFRADPDGISVEEGSRREVLRMDDFAANHNGGLLLFGPDRLLYVGTGDGGGAGDPERNGQDLGSLLGKLLRIDPRPRGGRPYGIPPDNPFVERSGTRAEVYSYGLRNPWRFSFDRETEALSIGDVGQDAVEEVNLVPRGAGAGANFGWSAFEGDARFNPDQTAPGHVAPVLTYPLDEANCAVTGGHVVRDRDLRSLYGRYLYGDFCAGELRSFVPRNGGAEGDRALGLTVPELSSFGEDRRGRIYVVSLDGPVYRLEAL
jgi:glucose/arabinose dehydrogenase